MSFASLGLSAFLLDALDELGYQQPTPIQQQAIPAILTHKDILAAAETGSGKTAAFALPVLQQLQPQKPATAPSNQISVLILVPTRELAVQVADAINSYGRYFPRKLKCLALFGGVAINPQMQALRGGADLVVATPGRLLDLHERNALDLSAVNTLILDEADRMLDLGFADELEAVLSALPSKRQNLLFSATFPAAVKTLTQTLLHDPQEIQITQEAHIPEQLKQRAIEVDHNNRTMLLKHLLQTESWSQVLIFVASKRTANNIEMKLYRAGIQADTLHGDLSQSERTASLHSFRAGRSRILIATDLAARGIDIPDLPCVINYDLPRSPSDYVHRIGRSGRAGEAGLALSFIDHEGDAHFRLIEKRIQQAIPREQIDGFERSTEVPETVQAKKGQAPVKGKRKSKKDKLREAAAKAASAGK